MHVVLLSTIAHVQVNATSCIWFIMIFILIFLLPRVVHTHASNIKYPSTANPDARTPAQFIDAIEIEGLVAKTEGFLNSQYCTMLGGWLQMHKSKFKFKCEH